MSEREPGLAWQRAVWDEMSEVYHAEIDTRFVPVVDHVVRRGKLRLGEVVLDLGTGTGTVAERAAAAVGAKGRVIAVDPSPEMLALTRRRVEARSLGNISVLEGSAEAIPAEPSSVDVVLASLSLMYAVDREAAAQELARVLRPGGRLVAAVWAGPEQADIVRFQQIAGRFAPAPPVPGVGPGALADPQPFLRQLTSVGIDTEVETEIVEFEFADLEAAWDALARVTASLISPDVRREAKETISSEMWQDATIPRRFRNVVQLVVGARAAA